MKKYSEDTVASVEQVEKLRLELKQRPREPDDYHPRLEMLEGLFAQVEDAVFVIEPDGRIVEANPAAGQMLGYETQELPGRHLWEFVAGGSRAEILGLTGRLVPGMPVTLQRTYECKDGAQKVVAIRLTGSGQRGGDLIIVSSRDVTGARKAEALLAGEKRMLEMLAQGHSLSDILTALCLLFEELCSGSLTSILLLDAGTRRLWHGAAPSLPAKYIEAINGGVIGPAVGSCGTAAYHGEMVIVSDLATDPLWSGYRDVALPHGLRACWSMPIFSTKRKVLGTFAIYSREPASPNRQQHDIIGQLAHLASLAIERSQVLEALGVSERNFRLIVDNIPGLLCTLTVAGKVELVNQRILDYTGKTLDELKDWGALIHPDDRASVFRRWIHAVETGEPYDVEHRIRGGGGAYRWFHVRGLPLRDQDGRIIRWYVSLDDIHDRKQAEAALSKVRADLAHLTRVTIMNQLTATIAHEVSQPLTAVINNANACIGLLADGANLQEIQEALTEIVEDAGRATAVIGRVRQLAKKTPIEKSLLDVREVITNVLALARYESAARHVTIQIELPEALPPIAGDQVQLQQVLLNLMVNGFEAMNLVEESKRILIIRGHREIREGTPAVVLSVQDAGTGFKPEEMDQLFEAFYTTKAHGMGMGLAISRSIIEAHGGHLWAEPNAGAGATFLFSLPIATDAHHHHPEQIQFRREVVNQDKPGISGDKVGRVTPCAPSSVWPSPARTE